MTALSLSLSQLQDSVAVIAAASQADSAVTSQGVVASALGVTSSSPATLAVQGYGASGDYSSGVVVGNAVNITV